MSLPEGKSRTRSSSIHKFLRMIHDLDEKSIRADRAARLAASTSASPRAPICCILGHIGSGKTTLLNSILGGGGGRRTDFTLSNAATYLESIPDHPEFKLPGNGILFIDTPGQSLLTQSRSQAVALCDIAILVADINIPLQPQTIESLKLLQTWNKNFIVALTQIDKISGWKTFPNASFNQSYGQQSNHAYLMFSTRFSKIIDQFMHHGINSDLYLHNNNEFAKIVSLVPTSAISGEGLSDIKSELIKWTQKNMFDKLITYTQELQCTVLDVKVLEGCGTTINVVLVNGTLHVGDQIVVCGTQGQIVTSIQALWTAPPNKELDAEAHYLCHKEIKGVKAVKIIAQGLEHAIAGTGLHVVKPGDDSKWS